MSGAYNHGTTKHKATTAGHRKAAEPASNSTPVASPPELARDALRQTVELAESEAAHLESGVLDRALAPDAVVATAGRRIAPMLVRMNTLLDAASLGPGELTELATRLDVAIGTIYVLARKHHVPMRESSLEEVFDREDAFRKNHTVFGPTNRADEYYAQDFVRIESASGPAPTADALASELEQGSDELAPRNRDELIEQVLGFAEELRGALDAAFHTAESTIREPSAPKRPDLVEQLLEMAMNVLSAQATTALGTLISAGLKLGDARLGVGEHLGAQLTDTLIDGFKDAGKENAKVAVQALGQIGMPPAAHESGLSMKTMYLDAAKERTSAAMTSTSKRFLRQEHALRRVPVDTLRALNAKFNDKLKTQIHDTYAALLVNEWVNFGKVAADQGEEMRDREQRPAHPSLLDQVIAPYGVLRIALGVGQDGQPRFLKADLPGIGDAVLARIRAENEPLSRIRLHRTIEIAPADALSLPSGGFDLDPDGKLEVDLRHFDARMRAIWAGFAERPPSEPISDGAVYLGMYAALRWLGRIDCSQIDGGGE